MKITIILPLLILPLVLLTVSAVSPNRAYALSAVDRARGKLNAIGGATGLGSGVSESEDSFYKKLAYLLNVVLALSGVIATIYVVVAGIKWMMAGGNEEKIKEAKATIRSSLIGLGVIIFSFFLVNFLVVKVIEAVT